MHAAFGSQAADDRLGGAHPVRGAVAPGGRGGVIFVAGEINALASMVLVPEGDEHRIAAFHNTVVASS